MRIKFGSHVKSKKGLNEEIQIQENTVEEQLQELASIVIALLIEQSHEKNETR
jgi:hypothetical protein